MMLLTVAAAALAGTRPRAREAGVPFQGQPGPLDAITDVPGVQVGQVTLIRGEGALVVGKGPVRTGVTAVFPKGKAYMGLVTAGTFVANGTGEMTGRALIDEIGEFTGPIVLTGTGSVGVVRDAVQAWYAKRTGGDPERTFLYSLPVVAETFDGKLNDVFGQHVKPADVFRALDDAHGGVVKEGDVGGGTGMVAYDLKGGIGTASRRFTVGKHSYTVGVLVQANYGAEWQLIIAGVPVGRELAAQAAASHAVKQKHYAAPVKDGSIIVVIGTDAPLLPHQLRRVAVRATYGIARDGGESGTTSGDMFVAFTTVRPRKVDGVLLQTSYINDFALNPLFTATEQATEEAVINALFAAKTMRGINGRVVKALPIKRVRALLRAAGRLSRPASH